jgi:cell division protein FtsB
MATVQEQQQTLSKLESEIREIKTENQELKGEIKTLQTSIANTDDRELRVSRENQVTAKENQVLVNVQRIAGKETEMREIRVAIIKEKTALEDRINKLENESDALKTKVCI